MSRVVSRNYEHVFFSALAPATHVRPHHGPTNKKLRCQLPLIVPSGNGNRCWLRVHDQVVHLEEGKCIVFDDSFEHEAINESKTEPRIILIFDVWHPDLSESEVRFLNYLSRQRRAAWRRHRATAEETTINTMITLEEANTDFYSVIEAGRRAKDRVSTDEVWGSD